jgi:SagB-type dehydrogenase family enzyme
VLHLRRGRLVAEDFVRGVQHEINEDALAVLRRFGSWKSIPAVIREFAGYAPQGVEHAITMLWRNGLLVAERTAESARDAALAPWEPWSPSGSFFHFATRKARYTTSPRALRLIAARITRRPMPPIHKDITGPRFGLVGPRATLARGSLGHALLRRRTCREFRPGELSRSVVEKVTVLTFGRLGWLDGGAYGKLLHRAAPSGGARHPVECYLVALNVRGLRRGVYHYSVRDNVLVALPNEVSREQVARFMKGQRGLADASALFLMSAVFGRTQWKYREPRAYRVLLLDLGHICQNLLLVATSLGAGVFCTAAFDDDAIDRYLGLDGVSEGVMYVAGIGVPSARGRRNRPSSF